MRPTAGTRTWDVAHMAVLPEKYAHLTRDEAIHLLARRDAERSFGLVWERPPQEEERAINSDYVALRPEPELSHGDAPYENLIIEGDNFDALRALRATHAGRVKVVLIDPPYNTGNRDFVYNDRFVDREHKFRHSLWIEFMYRRLTLAKELLRDDGVILVNIGDEEFAHLSMLMDQVFTGMKVGTFVWRTREGANDSGGAFFSQDHEYVLCFAGPRFRFGGQEKNQDHYSHPDNDPRGPWFGSDLTGPKNYKERPNSYYPIEDPNTGIWYPPNPERVWAFASKARTKKGQKLRGKPMEDMIADGRIIFPESDKTVTYPTKAALLKAIREGTAPSVLREDLPDLEELVGKTLGYGRPKLKRFQRENRTATKPLSSWILASSAGEDERAVVPADSNYIEASTSREATQAVNRILGEKLFSYPKPVSLYRELLAQCTAPDEGHIVLDFFAGSGTTAHAVLELNDADNGDRRFILVSSTEATVDEPTKNICRDVCRVRVARVMEGYQTKAKGKSKQGKAVAGLGGSFAYLKAVRLPMEQVSRRLEHEWVWVAVQLAHAARIDSVMTRKEVQVASFEDNDIVYVPEVNETSIKVLHRLFKKRQAAVVYSWRPGVLRQEFALEGVSFEKIPDALIARFGGRR